jgi:hypothetical protein
MSKQVGTPRRRAMAQAGCRPGFWISAGLVIRHDEAVISAEAGRHEIGACTAACGATGTRRRWRSRAHRPARGGHAKRGVARNDAKHQSLVECDVVPLASPPGID